MVRLNLDFTGDRFPNLRTSDISLLSHDHGRLRRLQRGIKKRELKEAIKHGREERANPGRDGEIRWKYFHNGLVFVTDASRRHEITSWRERKGDAHPCNSEQLFDDSGGCHFVLVVDCSSSMRTADVPGYSSRTEAVFDALVKDFMQQQLKETPPYERVVTLVLMGSTARVVFERQQLDEHLCHVLNKLKGMQARSHGNYVPALDTVTKILDRDQNNEKQLFVVFLSDGAPSDHKERRCRHGVKVWQPDTERGAEQNVKQPLQNCEIGGGYGCRQAVNRAVKAECFKKVAELGRIFGMDRIFLATVLFGAQCEDGFLLKKMAAMLPRSSFQKLGLTASFLRTHLSSLTGTLTKLCTDVMSQPLTVRELNMQARDATTAWTMYGPDRVLACLCRSRGGRRDFEDVRGEREGNGIQVAKLPFEKGAEWVVSRCREVVGPVAVGGGLVAKQPLHEELLHTAEFFLKSCRVQSEAAALAELFNRRLGGGAGVRGGLQLAFVHSFVYKVRHAPDQTVAPEQKEAVEAAAEAEAAEQALWYKVEEELSGPWIKWNNNNGRVMRWSPAAFAVLSQPSSPPPAETTRDVPSELSTLEVIAEEEGDAENDEHASQLSAAARTTRDSVTDSISDASVPLSESSAAAQSETELEPAHVPQCFSHFSHSVTDGRKLVCDLQGTWNATDGFVLTDPVIHYAGDRAGRRGGRNGRTDKGLEGVRQFFCTHICNPLCRRLGLEQPRSSLIAIAVLEFLDQKVKSGEQHADGWGGGELCNGSCEILEASGTTADPEEVTAVVEALVCNGVLCRGHDGYGYLTAEASLALDLTRQYFAAWKHRKQCTLPLMKRSLRAWREVAIRAQELRQECCVRACTVVESRDFAREAASFLKKPLGPKTLAVVADRVSSLVVRAPHHLQGLVNMIFDLAVSRSRHSIWMARLCNAVEDRLEKFDDENNTPANQTGPLRSKIPFITTLRKLCRTQLVNMPESLEEETKEEHDRMKGYVCFLGALFTEGIFSDMVLHICLKRLLFPKQASESMPEWSQRLRRLRAIKCLCALMASPAGRLMGRPEARDFMSYIDKYFEHMRHVKDDIQTLPGGEQLADMLQDTIDLQFWWR